MSTILNLRIRRVKCVDETNGSFVERFGDDEIALGGFAIDNKAVSTQIPSFTVSSSFDDGEVKTYNPPKVFASFQLGNLTGPANFSAGFLLAEKDGGGFADAIKNIFEKLVSEIAKKKKELESRLPVPTTHTSGTHTAAAVAPLVGGIVLSTIWPIVKPYVYDYVKNKIIGWFKDDLFPLHDITTTILNANHTWNGQKVSPEAMVEFRGNDGVYQLFYDWELR